MHVKASASLRCALSVQWHQECTCYDMQMIAMGLILHPGAYFRVPWNLLDFVIVVTSLASLAAEVNIVALRSLRLLRVLRPLRLISYFKVEGLARIGCSS